MDTKSPNTFESHYKAIICYNLACSYQLQGELEQCAIFLRQAIKFVDQKLEQLPQGHQSARSSMDHGREKILKKGSVTDLRRVGYQPVKKKKAVSKPAPSWINSNLPCEILERAVHLIRFQCRFTLQLCAVLSQLNDHEAALVYSKRSQSLAKDLSQLTLLMV